MTSSGAGERSFGIEALNVYCGLAQIPIPVLFEGRGLDPARLTNLDMESKSVAIPFEDPVSNAVNAAKPIVDALGDEERDRIELVLTSTESGVDYSKSITSYIHDHLGLSRHCRLLEVKQACYAATGALQLATGYLAAQVSPGGKALVIATDVALVDEHALYAEPATGHGAAALLLGDEPEILAVDLGAFGTYSYETMDSARPAPHFDIADVDRSLFAYLDCLSNCFGEYSDCVDGTDLLTTFDYLAAHTPFAGIVKAAHRKLMREHTSATPDEITADFRRRVAPSLAYPRLVGNLCSASVYLALASVIDAAPYAGSVRVGMYSYGSGCSSEFFSGVVGERAKAALAKMGIENRLAGRREVTYEEYVGLLKENRRCLVPIKDRTIDVDAYRDHLKARSAGQPILLFTGVKDFHRRYEWA